MRAERKKKGSTEEHELKGVRASTLKGCCARLFQGPQDFSPRGNLPPGGARRARDFLTNLPVRQACTATYVLSQSRQTSAESADSRFLSLAVVPIGEDGGLQ
jgi:hypothetical protein